MSPSFSFARCTLLLIIFLPFVLSQNFTVPSAWQDTTSNLTRAERETIAIGAAQELQSRIDQTLGTVSKDIPDSTTANIALVLSSQDQIRGNATWKSQVVDNTLHIYETGPPYPQRPDEWVVDISYFGLAELSAYLAYNDTSHLEVAKANWDLAYSAFITPSAAESGNFPRAFNTTSSCQPTLAGLVFDNRLNATNLAVSSHIISPWFALTSRLAELTGNTTYLTTAELTVQFMQTYMLDPTHASALVVETLDVTTCTPSTNNPVTWDLGPFIEGLSILANITHDETYSQLLYELIPSAVVTPAWHNAQGIITEDVPDYRKGTMIHGLLEARARNPSNIAMKNLIDSYITMQFNAIQANARIGSSDDYRISWVGGGWSDFTTAGNLETLSVLNAALDIAPSDSPSTSAAPAERPPNRAVPVAVIVGAVVGSIVGLATLLLAATVFYRRRKRAHASQIHEEKVVPSIATRSRVEPVPFTLTAPFDSTRPPKLKMGVSYSRRSGYFSDSDMDSLADIDIRGERPLDMTGSSNAEPTTQGSAVVGLTRRLDALIEVLALRGEVEGAPPQYEEGVIGRAVV
ncbi:unnamed protein product [Peniophora sp. CBMAI 1063]|nr:unnamed protein product [Peniophora sp. CBMAI 1063]